MELATKVLTLILAAMDAADADLHSALRLRFIKMLLAKGEATSGPGIPESPTSLS